MCLSTTVLGAFLGLLAQQSGSTAWEVVRPPEGDVAFSMPASPARAEEEAPEARGRALVTAYRCRAGGASYEFTRDQAPAPAAREFEADSLELLRPRLFGPDARPIGGASLVVDGVPGDDVTWTVPAEGRAGLTTFRARQFVHGRHRYVLKVGSAPGEPLPEEAGRFLSSLTFEAIVAAGYGAPATRPTPPSPPEAASPATPTGGERTADEKVELRDRTPEDALRTFLLAIAAKDRDLLRAVSLEDEALDSLVEGLDAPAPPGSLATLQARFDRMTFRRLKAGDRVTMPGGRGGTIQPSDVRGRARRPPARGPADPHPPRIRPRAMEGLRPAVHRGPRRGEADDGGPSPGPLKVPRRDASPIFAPLLERGATPWRMTPRR